MVLSFILIQNRQYAISPPILIVGTSARPPKLIQSIYLQRQNTSCEVVRAVYRRRESQGQRRGTCTTNQPPLPCPVHLSTHLFVPPPGPPPCRPPGPKIPIQFRRIPLPQGRLPPVCWIILLCLCRRQRQRARLPRSHTLLRRGPRCVLRERV